MTRKRDELLDHDADGIHEFDNDLPRWWLYGFYFTIIFSALYLVNYHVLPSPFFGAPTIAEEYRAEVSAAEARAPRPPAAAAPAVVAKNDADSLSEGKALFEAQAHMCVTCHRADLGGLVGPNLTDDFWIHGCTTAAVAQNIKVGFTSQGMLPYGGGPALTDDELAELAGYILSKRGSNPANAKAKDPTRDVECK